MRFIGSNQDRPVEQSLKSHAPKYYELFKVVNEIMRVDAIELEELYKNINDVFSQYIVDKSTWGLAIWERELGIKVDESKSDDERRSVIKSKLRGTGTSTVTLIKNVGESYLNGEVEIYEDNENYSVLVKFTGKRGNPSNMSDIKNAIRSVVPGHLAISYELTYISWNEIDSNDLTFDGMETYTWDGLEKAFLSA